MQTIEQAYQEVCRLHEQITNAPIPEIGPQMFVPFPPGVDPVAFAIDEVTHLKQWFENAQAARAQAHNPIAWVPRASIHASETSVRFQLEVPGVAKEDMSVSVAGGELVVRGMRKESTNDGALKPILIEQVGGAFERRFPVPPWCNPEKIHAKCAHGLLEVHLHRQEEPNPSDFRVEIS